MADYWLPEDLLFNVLERLPVHSLLRFKCVSKSCAALIDSKEFIRSHFNRTITNPTTDKFLLRVSRMFIDEHSRIRSDNGHTKQLDSLQNLIATCGQNISHQPVLDIDHDGLVLGSCNGLLCLKLNISSDILVLYNPCTKKFQMVRETIDATGGHTYGFGYDDVNDDYKVISISYSEVHIYSLNSNSWRRIQDSPNTIFYSPLTGVLANGCVHWLSSLLDSIIAIDLSTEKWHLVPLPEFTYGSRTRRSGILNGLGVLNGSLSVVMVSSNSFATWVTKDYGKKHSWTKLMEVPLLNDSFYFMWEPIAYSEINKQLIFRYYDMGSTPGYYSKSKYRGYDMEKNSFGNIVSDEPFNLVVYMHSLVQPFKQRVF